MFIVDPTSPTLPNLYGAPRSNTSGSSISSSPPSSAGVAVPQPLSSGPGNNTKNSTSNSGGGTGRKYQCKMCPQVRINAIFLAFTSPATIFQLRRNWYSQFLSDYRTVQLAQSLSIRPYGYAGKATYFLCTLHLQILIRMVDNELEL